MKFNAAVIVDQNETFAIVLVKKSTMANNHVVESTILSYQHFFKGLQIVLASEKATGKFTFLGRADLLELIELLDLFKLLLNI